VALDAVWAQAQEAGLPMLFHVGGEEKINPVYKLNGLPPVPDFHGGDDNFTSVSYMPIPNAVMQTLATPAGSSRRPASRCACSRRTIRMSKAGATR
jgi:hypothetical protein